MCQGGIVVVLLCPEDTKAASDVSVEYTFSQTISLDFPDHPFLGYVLRDLKVLLTLPERDLFFFFLNLLQTDPVGTLENLTKPACLPLVWLEVVCSAL